MLFLYVTQAADRDTDEVVSTPGALTFTTMTWATAQIVMIAAVEDGDAQDDRTTLGNIIDGCSMGDVRTAAGLVTVKDNDEQIVVAPGTTTQETVGSQTLVVTAAVKAPAIVRITKLETLATDVTVTSRRRPRISQRAAGSSGWGRGRTTARSWTSR